MRDSIIGFSEINHQCHPRDFQPFAIVLANFKCQNVIKDTSTLDEASLLLINKICSHLLQSVSKQLVDDLECESQHRERGPIFKITRITSLKCQLDDPQHSPGKEDPFLLEPPDHPVTIMFNEILAFNENLHHDTL